MTALMILLTYACPVLIRAGGCSLSRRHRDAVRAGDSPEWSEPVSAAEAYRIGLVNRVLPLGRLRAGALSLARQIATRGSWRN